jgi:hypothetical protein
VRLRQWLQPVLQAALPSSVPSQPLLQQRLRLCGPELRGAELCRPDLRRPHLCRPDADLRRCSVVRL